MRRAAPLAALLLAACKVGPDWERPEAPVPEAWRQPALAGATIADLAWWELYGDPALQDLVRAALEHNQDLRIAAARVEEARAVLGFVRTDQLPRATYSGSATRQRVGGGNLLFPGATFDQYELGGALSWEVDLWGGLRRSTEAAREELLATEEARRALTLSLVAEVASSWFLLLDLDAQLAISRRTLEGRAQSTELIRSRFEEGVVSELDLRQAQIEQAAVEAAIPALERAIAEVENGLAVLVGRPPSVVARGAPLGELGLPPDVPAGLPSALLERRPDVLGAERLAHAATARIGVAEALRLPSLRLTAAGGWSSLELSDVLESDSLFGSLAAGITGPLFEFGRNARRVEIERARAEQAVLAWERAVIQALREVEDGLVGLRTAREEHAARRAQVESARVAARLSRARYDGGVTSYLEVLDLERTLFAAELEASATLRAQHVALVRLYKALGGGWSAPDEPPRLDAP